MEVTLSENHPTSRLEMKIQSLSVISAIIDTGEESITRGRVLLYHTGGC